MLKKHIKKLLGQQLLLYRCQHLIKLQNAAEESKISWQKIDKAEIGITQTWNVYQKLLDIYHKQIKIELIDIPAENNLEKQLLPTQNSCRHHNFDEKNPPFVAAKERKKV